MTLVLFAYSDDLSTRQAGLRLHVLELYATACGYGSREHQLLYDRPNCASLLLYCTL